MASKLNKKDYFKTSLRSYLLQNAFNYNAYQGVSYLNVIMPALKKMYKDEPEKLKEAADANIEFYNTSPHMLPFVTNMQLAMYDNNQSIEDARSIKMALMGPMAGIGDSIGQFGLAPLFSTIFAGLALDGLSFAPMGFWICIVGCLLALRIGMGQLGYKLGTSIIETLSDRIRKISAAANIVGVTVISGLATNFVKMKFGIEYSTTLASGEEQIVALQTIFDKIMPKLLPVMLTVIVYYLIKEKKWTTYQLLILLFVIGIVGSALGILG